METENALHNTDLIKYFFKKKQFCYCVCIMCIRNDGLLKENEMHCNILMTLKSQ